MSKHNSWNLDFDVVRKQTVNLKYENKLNN